MSSLEKETENVTACSELLLRQPVHTYMNKCLKSTNRVKTGFAWKDHRKCDIDAFRCICELSACLYAHMHLGVCSVAVS